MLVLTQNPARALSNKLQPQTPSPLSPPRGGGQEETPPNLSEDEDLQEIFLTPKNNASRTSDISISISTPIHATEAAAVAERHLIIREKYPTTEIKIKKKSQNVTVNESNWINLVNGGEIELISAPPISQEDCIKILTEDNLARADAIQTAEISARRVDVRTRTRSRKGIYNS